MKKILFILLLAVVLVPGCQKNKSGHSDSGCFAPETVKISRAVITGRDLTKCACCWGWIVQVDNTVYKFEKIPPGSPINLDNLSYPATVNISWRNSQGSCAGKIVEILSISQ